MNEDAGKIVLNGFELEPSEMAIVENIIKNYKHKISLRGKFDYVRLRMKKSQKGKAFMHQIEGKMKSGNKIYNSKTADYNLFAAVDAVLEKLMHEMMHVQRTSRQK